MRDFLEDMVLWLLDHWVQLLLLAVVVAGVVFMGYAIEGGHRRKVRACEAMMAQARTSADSLLVMERMPVGGFLDGQTCAFLLVPDGGAR